MSMRAVRDLADWSWCARVVAAFAWLGRRHEQQLARAARAGPAEDLQRGCAAEIGMRRVAAGDVGVWRGTSGNMAGCCSDRGASHAREEAAWALVVGRSGARGERGKVSRGRRRWVLRCALIGVGRSGLGRRSSGARVWRSTRGSGKDLFWLPMNCTNTTENRPEKSSIHRDLGRIGA
jgi:hypothetical protein